MPFDLEKYEQGLSPGEMRQHLLNVGQQLYDLGYADLAQEVFTKAEGVEERPFMGEHVDLGMDPMALRNEPPFQPGNATRGRMPTWSHQKRETIMDSIHEQLKTGAIGDAGGVYPLEDWVMVTKKAIQHGKLYGGDNSRHVHEQDVIEWLRTQGLDTREIIDVMGVISPFIAHWNTTKEERNLGPWTGYDR